MIDKNPLNEDNNSQSMHSYELSLTELEAIENIITFSIKKLIELEGYTDSRNYSLEVARETIKLAHIQKNTLGKFDFRQALDTIAKESENPSLMKLSLLFSKLDIDASALTDVDYTIPKLHFSMVLAPLTLQMMKYLFGSKALTVTYKNLMTYIDELKSFEEDGMFNTGMRYYKYIHSVMIKLKMDGVITEEDLNKMAQFLLLNFNNVCHEVTK